MHDLLFFSCCFVVLLDTQLPCNPAKSSTLLYDHWAKSVSEAPSGKKYPAGIYGLELPHISFSTFFSATSHLSSLVSARRVNFRQSFFPITQLILVLLWFDAPMWWKDYSASSDKYLFLSSPQFLRMVALKIVSFHSFLSNHKENFSSHLNVVVEGKVVYFPTSTTSLLHHYFVCSLKHEL